MRTRAKTNAGESKRQTTTGIFTIFIIIINRHVTFSACNKSYTSELEISQFLSFKDLAMTPPWLVSATVFVPNITTAARTMPSSVQVQDRYYQQCDRWRA